jgi:hypothetical protein
METRSYNVYKFNELPAEAKTKAIEKHQYIQVEDYDWHQWIIEDWTGKLNAMGYEDAEIEYNGFYSQGDGACFSANIDLEKWLTVEKLKTKYTKELKDYLSGELTLSIKHQGYYSHEMTMFIDSYGLDNEELESLILEDARKQARLIYAELMEGYENLTSDESVAEMLEVNEYDLTIDGKID